MLFGRLETVQTAYTVDVMCSGIAGDPIVMFAPNSDQNWPVAKGYHCITGTCWENGQGWWDKTNAPAGGPEVLADASAAIQNGRGTYGNRYSDSDYYAGTSNGGNPL